MAEENWERLGVLAGFTQEKKPETSQPTEAGEINLEISSPAEEDPLIPVEEQESGSPISRFSFSSLPTQKLAWLVG
ncbi:MAG: hypothetical protein ACRDEA_02380, partial [Microcystaceae cyanobacterium]